MAMVVSGSCRAAARGLQWGASWAERRFLGAAGGARLGCWRQRALSGQRRGRGGSQVELSADVRPVPGFPLRLGCFHNASLVQL